MQFVKMISDHINEVLSGKLILDSFFTSSVSPNPGTNEISVNVDVLRGAAVNRRKNIEVSCVIDSTPPVSFWEIIPLTPSEQFHLDFPPSMEFSCDKCFQASSLPARARR